MEIIGIFVQWVRFHADEINVPICDSIVTTGLYKSPQYWILVYLHLYHSSHINQRLPGPNPNPYSLHEYLYCISSQTILLYHSMHNMHTVV